MSKEKSRIKSSKRNGITVSILEEYDKLLWVVMRMFWGNEIISCFQEPQFLNWIWWLVLIDD